MALLAAVAVGCTTLPPDASLPASSAPAPTGQPTAGPTADQTASGTPTPPPSVAATAQPTVTPSGPTPSAPSEHRIGVRYVDGVGELYDRLTNERFTPRGNNLIRLDSTEYHNTFNPAAYDPADLDAELERMAGMGYNVVRVFLDHRVGGLSTGPGGSGLSGPYLDNLVDFLHLAREHELQVMITQDWLPDFRYPITENAQVRDINLNYVTESGVAANAAYFRDLIGGLLERGAPLDTIWSYELRNELIMLRSALPFSLRSGTFEAPGGGVYDLADEAQRHALLDDSIVHWIDTMRAAILDLDPTALVSIGFFAPPGPESEMGDDQRILETRGALTRSSADFVDVHGYAGIDSPLERHMARFGISGPLAKPVVMGEMGAFHFNYPDVADALPALISWQAGTCPLGIDGWLLWTWDTPGETWAGTQADALLAEALAPRNRPDPCSRVGGERRNVAVGARVRASLSLPDQQPELAVDGILDTSWGAGAHPRQWIEIELAEPVARATLRLVVSQYPNGPTTHRLYRRGGPGGRVVALHTFSGHTSDGDVLTFELDLTEPITMFRVETRMSPSWVSWREIQVLVDD